jgi:hypothetical protein
VDFSIPRIAVSLFLVGQALIPFISPFSMALTYMIFTGEERKIQKYPFFLSLLLSLLNTFHAMGIF